jgi:hypothetical protein
MERGFDSEYFDQGLAAYFSGQVNPDLLQVGFAENEASPAVKAEPSSPDTHGGTWITPIAISLRYPTVYRRTYPSSRQC